MKNVINSLDRLFRRRQNFILMTVALSLMVLLPYFIIKSKNSFEDIKTLNESQNIEKINFVLKRNESLRPGIEGLLVQKLLNEGNIQLAKKIAKRALERTKKEAPFFVEYAESTLLISEKKFSEALKKTKELKEALAQSKGTPLYGYNLIRLAFLYKITGNSSNEMSEWKEIETYLSENPTIALLFEKAKLLDYIAQIKN